MTDRAALTDTVLSCFDEIEALVSDLGPDDWAVQSCCPDWDVKGVVTHLAGIEDLLLGWVPAADDEPPPFQKLGPFEAAAADWSGPELAARLAEVYAGRRADLAAMSDDQWTHRCMTPVGPGTYDGFMAVRVFDLWVHVRDITWPLGRDTDDSGARAELALDQVHNSLGYIAGKKIGLPDGMSLAFHLSGGVERDLFVQVDGRAAVVDHLDDPTVHVDADSTAFAMLACGRVDPQEQIDAGHISWRPGSGTQADADQWGEQAARNLRFTM